jgi:hypothetical protein
MRRLMQLCCIFLLLFAQHTALTHALWHAQRQLPPVDLTCSTTQATHDTGSADIAALCAFDVAVGQVLGGVLPASAEPPPPTTTTETPHLSAQSSPTSQFLAPLSRGPPSPLAF